MFSKNDLITIIRHKKAELDVWVAKYKEVEAKEREEKEEKLKKHVMQPFEK